MVRIAPVRLSFNPKTLWFDAGELDLHVNDRVVVSTARGAEFGTVANPPFEMAYEDTKKLKSPLKPVKRIATEEDAARADELLSLSRETLPVFKDLAAQIVPDMNPVAVEFMFDGDKAVFYFESEERVDFRDLVRKLAAELHVRVDMKQIGVRDGARLIGGLGHCGQELCCRRLGAGFDPVSIRMAKEQDLSLNPQKISGMCGRLMCCLRYEYEAYKDFHSRAPKKNARIATPDGEGKVVDLNVPREIVSIKVGDEKPVKVPLSGMDAPGEGARPTSVGEEAWERAGEPAAPELDSALSLFTNQLSGEDKLAEPGTVRHVHGEGTSRKSSGTQRSRKRGGAGAQDGSSSKDKQAQSTQRKGRRRRSTTVGADGAAKPASQSAQSAGGKEQDVQPAKGSASAKGSSRRRSRSRSGSGGQAQRGGQSSPERQQGNVQVGRNSSAIRSGRPDGGSAKEGGQGQASGSGQRRRRRRTHKSQGEGSEE